MDTARNQLCYGNVLLSITPRDDVSNLAFDTAGDLANITDILSLQLSSMSITDESWGIALMRLQANLPDTLPGQNVTFLLFGDVQIDDVEAGSEAILTTTRAVNVRMRPSTTTNNIMTSLPSGQTVVATGRLSDSSWVRIKVKDDVRGVGWVSADFLEGDLDRLVLIEPDAQVWGPMQAFYFRTRMGDRPCEEAPDSGILIQTPEGAGKITLKVNDVEVRLGSTVYLQAQPGNMMIVTVVEGQATLTAGGQTQVVPAGTFSQVQLDAAGKAIGKPSYPQPYDQAALQTLPLDLRVFHRVHVTPPLAPAEIVVSLDTSNPPGGYWYQVNTLAVVTCPAPYDAAPTGTTYEGWWSTLTFSDNRDSMTVYGGWNLRFPLARVGENVYTGTHYDEWGQPVSITVTFTSRTTYDISSSGRFYDGDCGFDFTGSGEFRG